jgi:histone chaperone ASF1
MSTRLNVCSVQVLDNPLKLTDPIKVEITFEVFELIPEDVEWDLVFVASDGNEEKDQLLESVIIGPIKEGRHKFTLEADPPALDKLTDEDLIDLNALLLRVKYRDQVLVKVGWYIANEYADPELMENPPVKPIAEKLQRKILADDIRVTTFGIKWDDSKPEEQPNEDETMESANEKENIETATGETEAKNVNVEIKTNGELTTSNDVEMAH